MAIWQFFDYHPEGGGCPVTDWYDQQPVEVRAALDAVVDDLAVTENWTDSESFEELTRREEHLGLSWLRFHAVVQGRKINYRAVGRWREAAREFIFLGGLQKNGRVTIPPDAMNDAIRLLRQLEQGRGEVNGHFEEEEDMAEDGGGEEVP